MTSVIDRAVILRRFKYGESSLVVHVLTRDHGRVHLLAKGAYRPTSRYYALLDLFDTLELEWSQARGRELGLLRAGRLAERRHRIATDLERYSHALCVLELAELGALEARPDAALFDLVEGTLSQLAPGAQEDRTPLATLIAFELGFLQNLGLTPALLDCAACAGPAPPVPSIPGGRGTGGARAAFSAGAGGRLCNGCAREARAAGRRVGTLPITVLTAAAALLATEGASHDDPGTDLTDLVKVRDFVARFLEYQLQTRPKSYRRFLREPNRNRPVAPATQHKS